MKVKHAIRIAVSVVVVLNLLLFNAIPAHAQDEGPDTSYLLVPTEAAARADLNATGNLGSLVLPIGIDIPPSRGDTLPSVRLVYNSADQAHGGWVGNGWSLELGAIERSLEDGPPAYNNNDPFIIKLGKASGELVFLSENAGVREYRLERESLFLRVFFTTATQTWLAVDKHGVEYTFGSENASRLGDAPRTFRWGLESIVNPKFNHTTTITYAKPSPNVLYPQTVDYFHGKVEFILGDHPQPFTTHKYGLADPTRVDRILTAIETYNLAPNASGFELVSVFEIEYTQQFCAVDIDDELTCSTPLIGQITRFNSDLSRSLPPTVFTYADPSEDSALSVLPQWVFPMVANAGFTESNGTNDNGVRMADINNDGFPDIVQADGDNQRATLLNNQVNGWSETGDWVFPVIDNGGFTEDNGTGDNGVRLVDVDNDGFADIIQADGDTQRAAFLNNGIDGWDASNAWQVPLIANAGFTESDGSGNNGVELVDVNNDGFIDIVQADGDDQRNTFLNNQVDGWAATGDWQVPVIDNGGFTEDDGTGDNGLRFADLNGDGFPDLVQADGDDQRAVFLNNTTDGWDSSSDWEVPEIANAGFTEDDGTGDNGVRLADVNNDGFTDILQADGDDQRLTLLNNTTDGWDSVGFWEVPQIANAGFTEDDGTGDNGVRLVDVDNDGFVDLVQADGDDPAQHVTFLNISTGAFELVSLPVSDLQLEAPWGLSSSWELPVMDRAGLTENDGGGDNGVRFADLNDDGYLDVLQADGDDSGQHLTFLNNGVDGWEGTSLWQFPLIDGGFTEADGSGDNAVQLVDVNGDGFVDILQADGDSPDQHLTFLNDATGGWELSADWVVPVIDDGGFTESDGNGDNGVRLVDVDGDGFVDIIQADDSEQRETFLNNTNNGWTSSSLWDFPVIDDGGFTENGGEGDNGVRLSDVNGDGLVDILQADGDDQRATFLNDGFNGWESTTDWRVPVISGAGFTEDDGDGDNGVRLVDVNFDGFIDLVQADGDTQRAVYLNNGVDGWDEVKSWQIPLISQGGLTESDGDDDNGVRFIDVNGDGFVDILHADGLNERRTYLNGVTRPPLLARVDNGIGGVSEVSYRAYTGKPILYTVSRVADSDGFSTHTVDYEFEGPYFDRDEDEFRGFHRSRILSERAIVETYYHQGNEDDASTFERDDHFSKQGRAYLVRIMHRDNPALYYQALRNQWGRQQLANDYNFVFLDTEIVYEFDTDGLTNVAKASGYEYDAFGNLSRTEKFNYVIDNELDGDFVDVLASDNLITRVEYAVDDPNDPRIRAYPQRITAEDFDGRILRESRYFYDDLALGEISLGRLTQEQRLRLYDDLVNYPTTVITNTDATSPENVPTMIETATYQYDNRGNVISRTNPLGDEKSYRYDPTNQYVVAEVVRVARGKTTPENLLTQFEHDYRFGATTQTTSPNGALYQWGYDAFGRLISTGESDPSNVNTINVKETYTYTLEGAAAGISANIIEKTSLSGNVQERHLLYMDGYLRVVQTKALRDQAGAPIFATQDTRYNSDGSIEITSVPRFTEVPGFSRFEDDLAHTLSQYDGLGRLVATIPANMDAPNSPVVGERFEYIVQDEQQGKIVRKGNQEIRYLVNANQQITDITQVNGNDLYHTVYTYDGLDRLVRIEDHAGNRIAMRYDSLDRKREMDDPDIGLLLYAYDAAGNLTEFVDAKGETTVFAYDELFRLITKQYPGDASEDVAYAYDENGDTSYLTTIKSKNLVSLIDYDPLGRVVRHDREIDGLTYTLEMAYDNLGRILSLVYPDQDIALYEYFDNGGQLARVRLGGATIAEFQEYSPVDKALSFSYGNGTQTANQYYPNLSRLKDTSSLDPAGAELQGLAYRYNDLGNVLSIRDRVAELNRAFEYDDLNRLTSFTHKFDADASASSDSYAYDAIGNILEIEGREYTYDDDRPHIPLSLDGEALEFDPSGNQTGGPSGHSYVYDVNDRLVQAFDENDDLLAEYFYDSANGLVKKQTTLGQIVYIDRLYVVDFIQDTATKYIYAHQNLVASQETPVPAAFSGSPTFFATPDSVNKFSLLASALAFITLCAVILARRTVFTPGRALGRGYRLLSGLFVCSVLFPLIVLPPEVVAQVGPRLFFYHTDHLGSITLITNEVGNPVRRITYRPFGEILDSTGSIQSEYTFTGQFADEDVGLLYYQSRFYNPSMGRFLQPDSFIPNAADPQSLNRFNYVNNNPVNFRDPTGHWFGWDDLIVAGIGFVVGFSLALFSGADFKTALVAGLASGLGAWLVYNTLGTGVLSFQLGSQVAATAANKVFGGSRGGLAGDIVQLVTTYAASPVTSTFGLILGAGLITFTDRTWNNDFHFYDGTLWFRHPYHGKDAMTTGAIIHYDDESVYNEGTIKHELVHRRQFGFTGDGFVPIYFTEIGIRMLFGQEKDTAYGAQTFEAEAYNNDTPHGFLGPGSPEAAFRNIRLFDQNLMVSAPGRF